MRYPTRNLCICLLAAAWAACATPRTYFYTLDTVAKEPPAAAPFAVSVGPVSVPALVDRPQIVVRTGPNQVFPDEFHRWGSPLQDEIARVVAGNLASLLGTSRVTTYPGTPAVDGYRVSVEVTSFDSSPGKAAFLDAVWTVRKGKDGPVRSGRTSVREAVHGGDYAALAAAHSRALAKMSGDIADAVRSLESNAK